MADRVHPRDSPSSTDRMTPQPQDLLQPKKDEQEEEEEVHTPRPSPPSPEKPVPPPPPGTYVIQIPKDQVYRVPPPENASRYERLTRRRSHRRSPCCCCLCSLLAAVAVLLLLAAVAAGILYLVFRPEAPDYSIERISIDGINVTSASPLSPQFDVTVRANNPNDKIGIYYRGGSDVNVFFDDVKLCDGVLPVFYQPSNNVTVFDTALKGSGIELTSAVNKALADAQSINAVPLTVHIRAPVKIKVGAVKTWTITVKVDCDVTVDELTATSNIVSNECDYGVNLF